MLSKMHPKTHLNIMALLIFTHKLRVLV
jgi:hypothetical protein